MRHIVPKQLQSFEVKSKTIDCLEIELRDDQNRTLRFPNESTIIIPYFHSKRLIMAVVNSLGYKPSYLTLQGQNGKPILLESTIYLQSEWESVCHKCITQMYYIRIVILPVKKPGTENEALA